MRSEATLKKEAQSTAQWNASSNNAVLSDHDEAAAVFAPVEAPSDVHRCDHRELMAAAFEFIPVDHQLLSAMKAQKIVFPMALSTLASSPGLPPSSLTMTSGQLMPESSKRS